MTRKPGRRPPMGSDPDALGYRCSVCGSPVTLNADGCPHCGVRFAGVRCGYCEYVAPAEWFPQHTCPNCGVRPAPLPDDVSEDETCPSCGREVDARALHCRLCGWQNRPQMWWWTVAMVAALVGVPAFAAGADQGVISLVLKYVGLAGGAAIGIGLARVTARAHSWPWHRMVGFVAALGWAVAMIHELWPVAAG
ncbi:MAG: hypothetical protein AB7K09_24125 [Planctomycetota bacterium]